LSSPIPRNATLDSLRGLAVLTMIGANFAGEHLLEPHPMWFRFFGTFAAPLFVTLAGMMVFIGKHNKGRGFLYFLKRGAFVLALGALVDIMIWQCYPFASVDVLYLIGLALPLTYLFSLMPNRIRWISIVAVVGIAPFLQHRLGYADVPTFIRLHEKLPYKTHFSAIWKHWIIDGWFPLIPWIAFAWLGLQFESLRHLATTRLRTTLGIGLGVLAVGVGLWILAPGPHLVREGYSELFYPLLPSFFILSVGLMITLFWVFQRFELGMISKALSVFGRSSLLVYVLHLVGIVYAFPEHKKYTLSTYAAYYAAIVIGVWLMTGFLARRKTKQWKL